MALVPTIQVVSLEGMTLYRAAIEDTEHSERRQINSFRVYPATWASGAWRDTREEADVDLPGLIASNQREPV